MLGAENFYDTGVYRYIPLAAIYNVAHTSAAGERPGSCVG